MRFKRYTEFMDRILISVIINIIIDLLKAPGFLSKSIGDPI